MLSNDKSISRASQIFLFYFQYSIAILFCGWRNKINLYDLLMGHSRQASFILFLYQCQ